MSKDKIPVYIAKRLYDEIQKRVEESEGEFQTVEEYIEFVLMEVVKEEETEGVYTPEEEKKIMRRLKSLGYL